MFMICGVVRMQTLKGNIRVFCRVRPVSADVADVERMEDGQPVLAFPAPGACPITGQKKEGTAALQRSHPCSHIKHWATHAFNMRAYAGRGLRSGG